MGFVQLAGLTSTAAGPVGRVPAVRLPDQLGARRYRDCVDALGLRTRTLRGDDDFGWVIVAEGSLTVHRRLARQAGLLTPTDRALRGLPPHILHGPRCCAGALWRAALLAAGTLYRPAARRPGLAVGCPTPLLAHALIAPARTLGATARVGLYQGRDHTALADPADIDRVLTAAGGHPATAAWGAAHPDRPDRAGGTRPAGEIANRARSRAAALAATAEIAAVFDRVDPALLPAHLRAAGLLRLAHPELTLTELAALADPPLTKDAISGQLRRLLTHPLART